MDFYRNGREIYISVQNRSWTHH
eukprot:Gb_41111 [translate_table: standard]